MHLTPLTAMTYDIEALAMERVKGVSDTNLLWKITKNIRSLECVAGRSGGPPDRLYE
jgi:hypothetical protein